MRSPFDRELGGYGPNSATQIISLAQVVRDARGNAIRQTLYCTDMAATMALSLSSAKCSVSAARSATMLPAGAVCNRPTNLKHDPPWTGDFGGRSGVTTIPLSSDRDATMPRVIGGVCAATVPMSAPSMISGQD